jgi:hypothetical protein
MQPGDALVLVRLAVRDSPAPLYRTSGGCCLVGCSVVSGRPLRSRAMGCRSASASAWGLFWPPVLRPGLRPPRPPGGGGVGFTLRGEVWAEYERIGVFGAEQRTAL